MPREPEPNARAMASILFEEATIERVESQDAELLLLPLFLEERPPRGLLGAIDWRFGGRISRLIAEGAISAERGSLGLLPARRKLPLVDKLLIAGMGSMDGFSAATFNELLGEIAAGIESLAIRSLALALPGRSLGLIEASAAFDALIDSPHSPLALDLIVYDEREAVREMETLLATAKRRDRAHRYEV